MKRTKLVFLLLFTALFTTVAQDNYLNGYIIKNDSTITYGQIKYIANNYTAKECVFRWFDISSVYTFSPGDIETFGFTYGIRYKTVSLNGHKTFIACLTDGKLDLLYDGKKLFLDGMGLEMVPLGNNDGNVVAEGNTINFKGYKDLLEKLPDPENQFSVPEDISLKPEIMAQVIADYNKCRGSRATISALTNPAGIHEEMRNLGAFRNNFGVLSGANASKYCVTTSFETRGYVPEMDFYEITPVIGLFYNRQLSRKNDHFSFQAEVISFKTNVYIYDEYVYIRKTYRSDINFGYLGLKIPAYFRLSFSEGRFKPFMNLGLFKMFNFNTNYSRIGETETTDHVVRPFTDNSITLNKSITGLLTGIGMKVELNYRQCFYVEMRGEYGGGIFDKYSILQHTLSFNVIAGFEFL